MQNRRGDDERFSAAVAILLIGVLSLVGCGGGSEGGGDDYQTRRQLSLVAEIYGDYLGTHGNAAPKDDAEFRVFLTEYAAKRLKAYNVADVDELLKSPRDGQPFTIVCGKRLAPPDSPNTPWAAYEQTGVDGTRLAAQVRPPGRAFR